jgi:A/G-specific adenine glycosylase
MAFLNNSDHMSSECIPRFVDVFPHNELIAEFQESLVAWHKRVGRDDPWRRTRDPYAILVSEIMLQQTRVETVLRGGFYERWMSRFPHWEALAHASEGEVLKAWEGLGYYRRARYLQRAAQVVLERWGGMLPGEEAAIRSLPGVGDYTAGAILSFAFGVAAPLVDGNVMRVFARVFACEAPIDLPATKTAMWGWARDLLPDSKNARTYNAALMELGQRVCTKARPHCSGCPVEGSCLGKRRGVEAVLPKKLASIPVTATEESVVLIRRDTEILIVPETGTRRQGLWKLPELTPALEEVATLRGIWTYSITRYRVQLRVFEVFGSAPQHSEGPGSSGAARWVSLQHPQEWPSMGAPYLKVMKSLQSAL